MSGSEEHHHKHTSTREEDQSTDTYREGFQKGQSGGDRGLVSEYDGGNSGRSGLGGNNTSDRYNDSGAGRDTSSGTDYKSSGNKGYDSGPVSAPAQDSYTSGNTGGSSGATGGNKHYGLDDGYVTRDMSVLGINERGGGQNVGMSSGGGARNDYSSGNTGSGSGYETGTGHGYSSGGQSQGVHFGGDSELGSGGGGGYQSRQSELGPAGVGVDSTRGQEYGSSGLEGHSHQHETGSVGSGTSGGLQTGGLIDPEQVEDVHAAAKPPSKVKQVVSKVLHHKAKGPYDASPQTGPAAFTPMSTAIAGGQRPRPEAQSALGYHPHGMPETEQSVGALGHGKTKLKTLEQL